MPQAWVMAQQLRESPPETAGNLLPGKWEADLGQGGDMNGESHNRLADIGVERHLVRKTR